MQTIAEEFIKLVKRFVEGKLIKNVTSTAFFIAESLLVESQAQFSGDLHTIIANLIDPTGQYTQREQEDAV
jgi:hypothetical protein